MGGAPRIGLGARSGTGKCESPASNTHPLPVGGKRVHVDNWPKGTQPERPDGDRREEHRGEFGGGLGTDPFARSGDEVVWPEAAGRTGSVPRQPSPFGGVPRQPDASGREAERPADASAPWERPDQPGRSHDPHEVTVQLDGVGRELDDGPDKDAEAGAPADGPVFVDESGRRRNRYRRLGIAVGTACAAYAVVIVGTLVSGNSDAPWLPVPMQKDDKPAGKVDSPPLPDESVDRSDTADGVVLPPGADEVSPGMTPAPGRSGSRGRSPDGSRAPKPSASAKPSGGASTSARPKPSASVKDHSPSASVSQSPVVGPSPSVTPSPTPSESGGPTPAPGSGTDTVADGPKAPAPAEPGPAAPQNPQDPQNPENPA